MTARPMSRNLVLMLAGCVLALVMAVLWVALAGDRAAAQEAGEIVDFDIVVPDAPLTVGDTIEFTNNGERPHTVTDRGDTFDTNAVLPGDSATVTFDVPGTYEIFCRINPGQMNATVVVEPGPEPPTEVRIQALDPAREGQELSFDPSELEVQAGTAITVANVGGARHTLTAEDGSFDTGTIEPGAEEGRFAGNNASFVADQPGTFNFQCQIHPQAMQGTLTVVGEAAGGEGEDEPEPPPEEPADEAAPAVDLSIGDFFFDPVEIEVQPGAELTWTNAGDAPHTATFDDVEDRVRGLDTGTIDPGASARLAAPDAPGSYSYFCAIHPGQMRAVLVVAPPEGATAETEAAPETAAPAPPDEEEVAAEPAADTGSFGTGALVGAIAIVLLGAAAVGFVVFGRRSGDESG